MESRSILNLRMPEANFSLAAVVLGGGRSTRMGRPKLLLPWGKASVLGHLVNQWRLVGATEVLVVHAVDDSAIIAELDRLEISASDRVANPNVDRGMFGSIVCVSKCAIWRPSLTHWAIVLGDQPHLRRGTLTKLVEVARQHPNQVCQPLRNGRRYHPVVLPRSSFVALAGSNSDNLKQFLADYEIIGSECDDPGLELDIDLPVDYHKALALAGLSPS
jgi:molybdenum cofactor cytidylyltransferase